MDYESYVQNVIGSVGLSRSPAPYGLIRVHGPESVEFLHRMCSQDVAGMVSGQVSSSAFLDGKGRLLAVCELLVEGDTVWLSTQDQLVDSLAELLERFHFTEDLVVDVPSGFACADVLALQSLGALPAGQGELSGDGLVRLAGVRNGVHWLRCHGPAAQVESWSVGEVPPAADPARDCLRYLLREPRVGVDSESNTLALEWPIDDHISTTKGCYTGQEVVARIHTYGHTNRSLCLLEIDSGAAIDSATPIVEVEDG
ncbi:MAG: hypothetical protein VX951_10125, partial [Planctomycetota bacterium]|nr:hypothetical protein [Planctomycetota bacterium]